MKLPETECQVLVIGGGAAGSVAAIAAAKEGARVTLVNQGPVGKTGLTVMAGGGICIVGRDPDPGDSVELHFEDMVTKGHYLGDQNLLETMTREAPERTLELEKYGIQLRPIRQHRGKMLKVGKDDSFGHSFMRGYFLIGSELMKGFKKEIHRHPEITVLEDYFIFGLLTSGDEVAGALYLDMRKGEFGVFRSSAVILATGGAGELYSFTTNRPQMICGNARGTGYAFALEAGAKMIDMEMTQFYPATPVWPPAIWGIHSGIVEEILPRAGAKVLNAQGQEFLPLPLVRDRTARMIYQEIAAGRGTAAKGVVVDVTKSQVPVEEYTNIIRDRVPAYRQYKKLGVDIVNTPFEVAPAFHFQIGGVRINENTETSVKGLFAAGEVSGNTHGANRLAGSAVPECLVFGHCAGKNAARRAAKEKSRQPEQEQIDRQMEAIQGWFKPKRDAVAMHELQARLGETMYKYVGLSRNEQGMTKAIEDIDCLAAAHSQIQVPDVKVCNLALVEAREMELMLQTARMIATSALVRTESRGAHYREDYPSTDFRNWTKHVLLQKKGGQLEHSLEPVRITRITPPEA